MKKTILKYGLISGLLCSLMLISTLPFERSSGVNIPEYVGYIVGYAVIVLSFLLVFFGIRSYRENSGGQITFAKAFGIGICITLITCASYVITWEIMYFQFMPDFMDKYSANSIERARAAGASAAAIQAQIEQAKAFRVKYDNVFYNSAITFISI